MNLGTHKQRLESLRGGNRTDSKHCTEYFEKESVAALATSKLEHNYSRRMYMLLRDSKKSTVATVYSTAKDREARNHLLTTRF